MALQFKILSSIRRKQKMKSFILFCIVQGCLGAVIVEKRAFCSDICPENYSPICGTDGKTYSNQCFLNSATCHDSSVQFAHAGRCGSSLGGGVVSTCPNIFCAALYDPVCGTDGKTYSNACNLRSKYCHGEVTVAYHSACL